MTARERDQYIVTSLWPPDGRDYDTDGLTCEEAWEIAREQWNDGAIFVGITRYRPDGLVTMFNLDGEITLEYKEDPE